MHFASQNEFLRGSLLKFDRRLLTHTTVGVVAIVKDDAATRKSLDRLLQVNDYATTTFASAEEFLQSRIVDRAIGLVLDIHLGGMSSIELRRHLGGAHRGAPRGVAELMTSL